MKVRVPAAFSLTPKPRSWLHQMKACPEAGNFARSTRRSVSVGMLLLPMWLSSEHAFDARYSCTALRRMAAFMADAVRACPSAAKRSSRASGVGLDRNVARSAPNASATSLEV
jgi:hypothetical protein